MNCRDVLPKMNAYLDGEVTPSEKRLLQAHLGTCQTCQQELEALDELHNTLRQQLKARAAQAAPSSQAWTLLQASLPTKSPQKLLRFRLRLPGAEILNFQKVAMAFLVLLALVTVVPPVWAQVQTWVGNWFSFSSPDGKNFSAIGGFTAFTPYHATYLPKGFQHSGLGTATGWPDYDALELTYDKRGGQFFTILQSKGSQVAGLPSGEKVQVGQNQAVFVPTFATSADELITKKPGLSIVTDFDYENTNLLAWFMGEIKFEIFSNLPQTEMLKVAESLVPMQTSEGEQPPAPN